MLHGAKRPRRHAEFALPCAPGRRDSRFRQCRHRDVGPRRAGPGAAGLPVGADARRPLSGRERPHPRRRGQLARHVGGARRVGAAGRAGRPDPHRQARSRRRRPRTTAEARIRAELRRINPSAEIGVVDWTSAAVAKLLTSQGFDAADPKADPRPWLSLDAHLASAHDASTTTIDGHDHSDHDHDAHSHCRSSRTARRSRASC